MKAVFQHHHPFAQPRCLAGHPKVPRGRQAEGSREVGKGQSGSTSSWALDAG